MTVHIHIHKKSRDSVSHYNEGYRAVAKGVKYDANPYEKGSIEHLDWSKGHNDARAAKAGLDSKAKARDAEEEKGHWITTHGTHIHVTKGGKVDKGPKVLGTNKTEAPKKESKQEAPKKESKQEAPKKESKKEAPKNSEEAEELEAMNTVVKEGNLLLKEYPDISREELIEAMSNMGIRRDIVENAIDYLDDPDEAPKKEAPKKEAPKKSFEPQLKDYSKATQKAAKQGIDALNRLDNEPRGDDPEKFYMYQDEASQLYSQASRLEDELKTLGRDDPREQMIYEEIRTLEGLADDISHLNDKKFNPDGEY